jgi:CorA-like Mg2+ transporter protein
LDVYDHLVRAVELVESQRDLLTGSLDIYLSAVANRTNEVMKVLTIYGTLAVPLVVIAGFFGMNLHLPWSNNPHGAWYASALMALSQPSQFSCINIIRFREVQGVSLRALRRDARQKQRRNQRPAADGAPLISVMPAILTQSMTRQA